MSLDAERELYEVRALFAKCRKELETAHADNRRLRAELAAIKQRRPAVEIRQVNDGFALYEAERLVRGGFDRAHTARLWAADQGLEVRS